MFNRKQKYETFEKHIEKIINESFDKVNDGFRQSGYFLKFDWERTKNNLYNSSVDIIGLDSNKEFFKHYVIFHDSVPISPHDFEENLNKTLENWLLQVLK
ncbi:MAG: hypothetical protein WC107_01635 [Patescibacteria group bacterium]